MVIEPLVAWLWAGGLSSGSVGCSPWSRARRRRATDPVSAPSAMVPGAAPSNGAAGAKRAPRGARAGGRAGRPPRRPGMSARRRGHSARWFAGAVLLVLVVVGIVLATRTPQEATAGAEPAARQARPGFTGVRPDHGGRPVSLHLAPRPLRVVNFFASWCIPCQQEAPDLSRSTTSRATPPTVPRW